MCAILFITRKTKNLGYRKITIASDVRRGQGYEWVEDWSTDFCVEDIQFLKLLNFCVLLGSLMKMPIFRSNLVLNMMKILNGLPFFFFFSWLAGSDEFLAVICFFVLFFQ